jgi:hypothetical protein
MFSGENMTTEDLNLSGIKNLAAALARTKNGTAAVDLVNRLGLWTQSAHERKNVRVEFPSKISEFTPSQLSDLYSTWTAEFGRVLELCGIVSGQEALLRIQLKAAQASTRARLRRNVAPEAKQPATGTLNDMVDEDPSVLDLIEQHSLIVVLGSHLSATKEATSQYLASISREISFRDSQMKARVY